MCYPDLRRCCLECLRPACSARRAAGRCSAWLLVFFVPNLLLAQDAVVLRDAQATYGLSGHLQLLEDPEGAWTIEDVSVRPLADRFERTREAAPGFGYSNSAYWVRFALRDGAAAERTWLLEVANKSLDRIELYEPVGADAYRVRATGEDFPFGRRDVRHRNFVFRLPDEALSGRPIYLRISSRGPVSVPLRVWSAEAFARKDREEQFFLGLFFGILLITAVYHLSLFVAFRDASYLYYVLFLVSFICYQVAVERIGFEYLWPNSLWWAERSYSLLGLFCAVWGLQFSRSFLHTRQFTPLLDRVLVALMAACLPMMLLIAVRPGPVVKQAVVLFFILIVGASLAASVLCLLRGERAARYYLAAWPFLLVGIFVGMLSYLGFFSFNLFGPRSVQVGSALEVTVLSLALGYRYNLLRKERERMRMRIASDLHDDIGSGLTQISLYSELVQRTTSGQTAAWAEQTGALARTLTGNMQDIVWAIKPEQESWTALEMRMKDYAVGLLAPKGIAFEMAGTQEHEYKELPLEVRRNLLLMFKEIVHNAARHAGCTRVQAAWRLTPKALQMQLCDDGRGFDAAAVKSGNGLKNLQYRAREIRASLSVDTAPGAGTCFTIEVPLGLAVVNYPTG